jgi:hypothetical protein
MLLDEKIAVDQALIKLENIGNILLGEKVVELSERTNNKVSKIGQLKKSKAFVL